MIAMDAFLERILEKQELKDFDGMLGIFRELDKHEYKLTSRFSVLKARAIQVADNSHDYDLHDVELCLLEAIRNDEYYTEAYIELGFYYYAVEDNCEKALKFFDQAINQAKNYLREAIIGKAKSLVDLNRNKEALICLDNERLIDEANFELIRKELSE